MIDARMALLSIGFLLISAVSTADLEYVSPSQRKSLESLFNNSGFSASLHGPLLQNTQWSCDMYGMRTHLQVQRGIKLYRLTAASKQLWRNNGLQVIEAYKDGGNTLKGESARVRDEIRITSDGRLISKMSLPNRDGGAALAYCLCQPL